MSNNTHKKFLYSAVPHQLPQDFIIQPVPKEIISFVSSILLLLPVKQQRLIQQKPSELAHSELGVLSLLALECTPCILRTSPNSNRTSSCPPSPKQLEKLPSPIQIKMNWWKEQSVPPCHMWHRPSGQTIGQTPDWTSTVRYASSSKTSSEDIATKMADDKNRRHYQ